MMSASAPLRASSRIYPVRSVRASRARSAGFATDANVVTYGRAALIPSAVGS